MGKIDAINKIKIPLNDALILMNQAVNSKEKLEMINSIVKDTFVIKPAFPGPDLCDPKSVKVYKMFVTEADYKKYIF